METWVMKETFWAQCPKSWILGFTAARNASLTSSIRGARMGAAIMASGRVIAVGANYSRTHPWSVKPNYNLNLHAEQCALIRRKHYDLKGDSIFVYRETQEGLPSISKPCSICLNLIKLSGIKKVRFIDENGLPSELRL